MIGRRRRNRQQGARCRQQVQQAIHSQLRVSQKTVAYGYPSLCPAELSCLRQQRGWPSIQDGLDIVKRNHPHFDLAFNGCGADLWEVRYATRPVLDHRRAARLLEFLVSRQGVIFSREQLLNAVWGQDRAITDRAVDVYVLRLRQKVESDPANPSLIHSVRGFCYTFEPRRERAAVG